MHHILYLSTAKKLFSEAELENILMKSRRNNTAAAITGVLLYHDGTILQVLEGEQEQVERLLASIAADDRHYGVAKILEHHSDRRYFTDWSMGFRRLSTREWNEVEGFIPVSTVNASINIINTSGTNELLTFIQSFCRVNFPK